VVNHIRVIQALKRYLKVHGRRILSNINESQEEIKIELRALFRYYEKESKDDRLLDHVSGFNWEGCSVTDRYIVVPVSLIRKIIDEEGKI